jgi:hypothetical protein
VAPADVNLRRGLFSLRNSIDYHALEVLKLPRFGVSHFKGLNKEAEAVSFEFKFLGKIRGQRLTVRSGKFLWG